CQPCHSDSRRLGAVQVRARTNVMTTRDIHVRKVTFGPEPGARARIGLIGLGTGMGTERDMHQIISQEGVLLVSTRVQDSDTVSAESLSRMQKDLRRAARTLLPGQQLDVIAYGCTSGAVAIGEERVAQLVKSGRSCSHVTNQFRSSVSALQSLRATRIALVCPYSVDLTDLIRKHLVKEGFQVIHAVAFGIDSSFQIPSIPPDEILKQVEEADRPNVDAIFICCGGLRTLSILDEIERRLSKPVVTSNQSLAWHSLRLAGIYDKIVGYGRLLTFPLLETLNTPAPKQHYSTPA